MIEIRREHLQIICAQEGFRDVYDGMRHEMYVSNQHVGDLTYKSAGYGINLATRARSKAHSKAHSAPVRPIAPPQSRRATYSLPPGTQAKLLRLGEAAEAMGAPLRHHLTVHVDGLALCNANGELCGLHPADATQRLLQLMRQWYANRGLPWVAVWVRERSSRAGEHLHLAFHLLAEHEGEFLRALARWSGEAPDGKRRKASSRLVGRSEYRNWDLRRDIRGVPGNPKLMVYLSKAEPNELKLWGRFRPNRRKPKRRYQSGGRIEGTPKRDYRWGVTRALGPNARAHAGLQ